MEECRAELDKMYNENFELKFNLGRKDAHAKVLETRLDRAEETLDYLLSLVRKRRRPADPADMVVEEEAGKKAEDSTPSVSRVTPAPVEDKSSAPVEVERLSAPVVEEKSTAPVVEEERLSAPSGEDVTSPVGEDVPSKTKDATAPQENNAAPIPLASTSETMGPPPPPNTPAVTLQPPTPQTSQEDQAATTHLVVPPKDPAESARPRSRSRSRSPAPQLVEQRRSPRLNSPGLPPTQPSSKRSGEPLDNEPPAKKARDC